MDPAQWIVAGTPAALALAGLAWFLRSLLDGKVVTRGHMDEVKEANARQGSQIDRMQDTVDKVQTGQIQMLAHQERMTDALQHLTEAVREVKAAQK